MDQNADEIPLSLRLTSRVLLSYPWCTDKILSSGRLVDKFSENHWLQVSKKRKKKRKFYLHSQKNKTLLRSLEASERAIQSNDHPNWRTLSEILVNNNLEMDFSYESVKDREIKHLQPRNRRSWALCALICAYRLIDVVAMVEDHPNEIPVPHHNRQKKLFDASHKV